MSRHEYKQTVCREYSQGVCHDGAAILKDGEPMTIEQILEELQTGQAARAQGGEGVEPVAWVTPLAHGQQVTFYKPPKPERFDDNELDIRWYCRPLVYGDTHPQPAKCPHCESEREAVAWQWYASKLEHIVAWLRDNPCGTPVMPEPPSGLSGAHPDPSQAAGVPERWKVVHMPRLQKAVGSDSPMIAVEAPDGRRATVTDYGDGQRVIYSLLDTLLSTTPQPEGDGWKPYYEHPEIGKPVLGYHPDWVDDDFCEDGIRECFTFGDGEEWQSARWDGYSDQWVTEDGAPTLWKEHPQPPKEGE